MYGASLADRDVGPTHICPIDPAISGQSKSISSLSLCKANLWRAGSGSERKPTRPAAEVRPTMSTVAVETDTMYVLPLTTNKYNGDDGGEVSMKWVVEGFGSL